MSYGGSSLLSSMIIFAVIQGLYILRQDEGEINASKSRKNRQNTDKKDNRFEEPAKTSKKLYEYKTTGNLRSLPMQFLCFLSVMMGYFAYFQFVKSEDFINSPYNTRQESFCTGRS
ncbi:MAG: hypothetical protein ACLT08_03355 [Roseburia inulinivorans]